MRVDISRFRVADHVGPPEADGNDVGMEDIEPVFLDELSGVGIEAKAAFLLGQALAIPADHVQAAVLHDGSGAAAIGSAPDEVVVSLGGVRRPFFRQIFFMADAVLRRASPVGPIGRASHGTKGKEAGNQDQHANSLHGRSS